MREQNDITAIILTKNEESNIERCLNSIRDLVCRMVVVDSGSTDRTVELARAMGAEIYTHAFVHYAGQFNWALDHTQIKTTWVYRIDADEAPTQELCEEIAEKCRVHHDDDVNAFLMKHRLHFLGKDLMHGGVYPFLKITVFKPAFGRFEDRAMGEHVVLSEGKTLCFDNDCIHYDFKGLNAFIEKHNSYASREAYDYFERRQRQQETLYQRAEIVKFLRDGVYYKLPIFLRAKLYYLYRYYFRLGFLDGKPGKIYAFIQAYFYRFAVDAKIYEEELRQLERNR